MSLFVDSTFTRAAFVPAILSRFNISRLSAWQADKALNIIGTPTVYHWNLIDQNRNTVSFQGNITVRIPVPSGLHGSPHVFRFDQ
jgi:hypothetical protein